MSLHLDREISGIPSSEYSTFGKPYPGFFQERNKDPVNCCLPGAFLDCPATAQLDLCPKFMAQRCANSWDEKCDLYLQSRDKINQVRDFLSDTLNNKFCQLSEDSKCTIRCEPFDPIAQTTQKVCTLFGNDPVVDSSEVINIGYYEPVSISPNYMGKGCRQTCDVFKPSEIDPNDPLINRILDIGYHSTVLDHICEKSIELNEEISHAGLCRYCDARNEKKIGVEGFKPMATETVSSSRSYMIAFLSVLIIVVLAIFAIYRM